MRRTVFATLGILESAAALLLGALAWQLPSPAEVRDHVGRAEKVSRQAGEQVRGLQSQLARVRASRPELVGLARHFDGQLRAVGDLVGNHQVNYTTVAAVGDALGDVAEGLDGLGATLDPEGLGQMGAGLKATAEFLDGKLAPAAEAAAGQLEKSTALLSADARRLAALLEASAPDRKAGRAAAESLARLEDGLVRMEALARLESFGAMREGFKGLEEALDTTAGQIDKMAGVTIPQVKVEGLKVRVEEKDFWPEGKAITTGLRKAAKGASAAHKEMAGLEEELPRLRASLVQSRKVVAATRQTVDAALVQREKLEPLLEGVPRQAARLAEELPRLGADLARVLRDTAKLREVARLLRETQKGVDAATERWPRLRRNLGKTSDLLKLTQTQLRQALANRGRYEEAARQTLAATRAFAGTLPQWTDQLEEDLSRQERSLAELGEGIDRVSEGMPELAQVGARLAGTARLLLAVLAVAAALHAGWVLGTSLPRGRRGAPSVEGRAAAG